MDIDVHQFAPTYRGTTHIPVLNNMVYHLTQEALYKQDFNQVDGYPWPTALFVHDKARGHAQLRPAILDDSPLMPPEDLNRWTQRMWQQREELSDLDADALDALSAIWLCHASSPQDDAVADVDDFLRLRGLQSKRNGYGHRGGYEPEQRLAMLRALSHIQNLWLGVSELEVYEGSSTGRQRYKPTKRAVQSRAFVITDRMGQLRFDGFMDVEKFIFRPGKIFAQFLFGPGRQTALLSSYALRYDPHNQQWEKRLTRYLSWQWRVRARMANYTQPYRVSTLLQAVGKAMDSRRASTIRDRQEKALETLQRDQVLAAWQYERWDEAHMTRRDWAHHWLQATIALEPPDSIRDAYQGLIQRKKSPPPPVSQTLGARIKRQRQALGLTQTQAAEQVGVHRGYFSRLERGEGTPSHTIRTRLEHWLTETRS